MGGMTPYGGDFTGVTEKHKTVQDLKTIPFRVRRENIIKN